MAINKIELANSFADFVKAHDWDIYFTATLRAPVKTIPVKQNGQSRDVVVWRNDIASMRKEFQFFFSTLNGYVTFFDRYMLALVCFDRAYKGGRLHVHALIQRIPPQYCRALQSVAYDFFGESKVTPYDPKRDVRYYFGNKYAYSGSSDFDFLKINARWRKPVLWPDFKIK
ncbi:MAG: hypothetical protein WC369_03045 [Dehalococcoidales bacterium]|jgi:hypothetical protein